MFYEAWPQNKVRNLNSDMLYFMINKHQGMKMCANKQTVNTSPYYGKDPKLETSFSSQPQAAYGIVKTAV